MNSPEQTMNESAPTSPVRLWNANYRSFVFGTALSFFGTQSFMIAQTLVVKDATQSGTLVGLLLAIGAVPMLIFGTTGGVLADRMSRLRLLILSDITCGVIVAVLAALAALHVRGALMVGAVFALSMVLESVFAFRQPSARAILPQLVDKADIRNANGSMISLQKVCGILGQTFGGTLYAIGGAASLFLVDSISYFVSVFFLRTIVEPTRARDTAARPEGVEHPKWLGRFWDDVKNGAREMREIPHLMVVVVVVGFSDFFTAPLITFMPFIAENRLGLPSQWFGYMTAALAAGGLAGSLASRNFKPSGPSMGIVVPGLLVVTALARICIGLFDNVYFVMPSLFLETASAVMFSVWMYSTLQERIPERYAGRVFGFITVIEGIVAPLGMAAGGVLIDAFPLHIGTLVQVSGVCMLVTSLLAMATSAYRNFFVTR